MLRLMGWLRKISLIGLIAAVLTPFVLRPFLTMGISAHHVTLVKTFTQPCPVKHQPCGLICQLDSQTREIDTRPENASEFLSLSGLETHASWEAAGLETGLAPPLRKSNPNLYPLFLRI